jgi:hypothetical protein
MFGCQNILFSDLLIQGDVTFDHRKLLKENVKHLKVFFILLLNKKFDDTLMQVFFLQNRILFLRTQSHLKE